MAVTTSLKVFMGLVGLAHALSTVQLNAELLTLHSADSKPKPPSLDDVEDTLGAVNDTIDKVSDIISTINSTAFDMLSTFLDSTGDFVEVLGTLQKAADAAAMFSPEVSETAAKFIDLANSTLDKATAKLPAIYAKVESQLDKLLAPIEKIALSVASEFLSAAQDVFALTNLTDSSLLKKIKSPKHVGKTSRKHVGKKDFREAIAEVPQTKLKKHTRKHAQNTIVVKKHKGKKTMVLLEERALRGEGVALNQVDQSVARKGGGSPCAKALAGIAKANATLFAMEAHIQAYNGTAFTLLGTYLDTATSALSTINSSIAPALDAIPSSIPSSITSPVTKGLDQLLSVGDTLTSTVQDNLATIEDMVTDAVSILGPVSSLADTLVEAVTQAQCAGVCTTTEQTVCKGAKAVSR